MKTEESSRAEPDKHHNVSSPVPEFQQERESSEAGVPKDDQSEARASPGLLLSVDENGNVEAMRTDDDESMDHQPMEDIQMSPIPFDREDPVSLMDLPENLLSLPISPCGPNDEPAP
jgi:hypothetical protein